VIKSEEGVLPARDGTWGRLSIPGTALLPMRPGLLIPLQVPLISLQAAMPIKDMATSTGTFGFLRCAYLVSTVHPPPDYVRQDNGWHSWNRCRAGHLYERPQEEDQ